MMKILAVSAAVAALTAAPALADTEIVTGHYAARCYEVFLSVTRFTAGPLRFEYRSEDTCTHHIYAAARDTAPRSAWQGRVNDNRVAFDFIPPSNFNAWGEYTPTEFHIVWSRNPTDPYEIERGTETGIEPGSGYRYSRPFLNATFEMVTVTGNGGMLIEPPTSNFSGTMRSYRPSQRLWP